MRADTLLKKGEERWVLDAKYKRSFGNESRNDRFQMCAYVLGFNATRATLVYPTAPEGAAGQRLLLSKLFGNAPVRVDAISLPMSDGVQDCKHHLAMILSQLRKSPTVPGSQQ